MRHAAQEHPNMTQLCIDDLPKRLAPEADYGNARLLCIYPPEGDGYAKADYWDPTHEVIVTIDVDLTGSTDGTPCVIPGSTHEVCQAKTKAAAIDHVANVIGDGVPRPLAVHDDFDPRADGDGCHFCGHKKSLHPLLVEGWASADGGAAEAWMDRRTPRVTCRGVFDVEA